MSGPILIALHDFHTGGTERVALALAARWTALGREVVILAGSAQGGLRDAVPDGVTLVILDPPVRRGFLSRLRLGRAIAPEVARIAPSVIFLPGNFHLFLASALRAAAPSAKIALKISNPPPASRFAAPAFRALTRAVDGFAAMNAGLARELRGMLPGRAVETLYDPLLTAPLPRAARAAKAEILWIGRLEPQKDVGLALETLRELQKVRDVHLTLIGDGRDRARLERGMTGLDVTHIAQAADVAPCLAAADALLITSRYEGGPAVAVEALAQGVPVVATDCSHLLREIIVTPEAGRIVASRRAADLAGALADICDAPRPAQADLVALVERFAADACARAYLRWFDAL